MKRKHSILRTVVIRFIICFVGTEAAIGLLEELFRAFVRGGDAVILYDRIPDMAAGMEPRQASLTVLWVVVQLAVYGAGVALFAHSISRKVSYPAGRMAEGFREVASGNLSVRLDFETETEFKEMRDSFNVMAHRLKGSEEKRVAMENERMRLFSHIAHDLKTPMTTISGYAGALANGMVEDAGKQREYQLAIKAKSEQMNELLDRLLSYSKLGAPQYQMKTARTDLAELLRAACASLFGEMEDKRMELDLRLPDEPVFCEVDALELNRAVGNLLTNAIRHNPAGSLLSVELREEAGQTTIQISNK